MLDFKEKKIVKNIIYSKISIFVVVVLLILVSKNVWGSHQDEKMTRVNMETSNHELQTLKEREVKLLSKIKELKTEEGIEKEIRSKFRVSKGGEQMIMIIDNEKNKNSNLNNKKNLFEKLRNFFSL